jgi:hypothetical protein
MAPASRFQKAGSGGPAEFTPTRTGASWRSPSSRAAATPTPIASKALGLAETLAEVAVGAHVELPGRSLQLAQGVEGLGGVIGRAVQGLQADEVGGGDAGPDTKDHGHSSH